MRSTNLLIIRHSKAGYEVPWLSLVIPNREQTLRRELPRNYRFVLEKVKTSYPGVHHWTRR